MFEKTDPFSSEAELKECVLDAIETATGFAYQKGAALNQLEADRDTAIDIGQQVANKLFRDQQNCRGKARCVALVRKAITHDPPKNVDDLVETIWKRKGRIVDAGCNAPRQAVRKGLRARKRDKYRPHYLSRSKRAALEKTNETVDLET